MTTINTSVIELSEKNIITNECKIILLEHECIDVFDIMTTKISKVGNKKTRKEIKKLVKKLYKSRNF